MAKHCLPCSQCFPDDARVCPFCGNRLVSLASNQRKRERRVIPRLGGCQDDSTDMLPAVTPPNRPARPAVAETQVLRAVQQPVERSVEPLAPTAAMPVLLRNNEPGLPPRRARTSPHATQMMPAAPAPAKEPCAVDPCLPKLDSTAADPWAAQQQQRVEHLQRLIDRRPGDYAPRLQLAHLHHELGQLDEAMAVLKLLLRDLPAHPGAQDTRELLRRLYLERMHC